MPRHRSCMVMGFMGAHWTPIQWARGWAMHRPGTTGPPVEVQHGDSSSNLTRSEITRLETVN